MKYLFNRTLYAINKKGKIKTWSCRVTKTGKDFYTIHLDSKTNEDSKAVSRFIEIKEGVNIGKDNETTPLQQALFEAESRCNKKLKEGYKETKPEKGVKHNTNALGFLQPMKAKTLEDNKKHITFPAVIQPKLNGHRAMVTRDDKGKLVMYSRKGNVIDSMQHILDEVNFLPMGTYLDGELYVHGDLLQDIGSVIKKYRKGESEKVKFIVYDCILPLEEDKGYPSRSKFLQKHYDHKKTIELIKSSPILDLKTADAVADSYMKLGFEGAIIRCLDTQYQPGVRSHQLSKVKPYEETEFVITDIVQEDSAGVNGNRQVLDLFICLLPEGGTFTLTAPGSYPQKSQYFDKKEEYIGKEVTVKHFGYTKDKKPVHAVALRIRDDI